MGYKQDQTLPSQYEYPRPEDEPDDVLPSYSETVNGDHGNEALNTRDPRSTSTESLNPEVDSQKRTLLLIYIHGFLGDETSFQSFPAHVHNLTCTLLSESHVVHTKIYPRYKSRKVIEFARNDFSNWLRPHESYNTDVILLGHSMGGLLGAEVAIMPANPPSSQNPFQHKIVGTVNLDTPFLGMHPGIIFAGIGSLFRPAPEAPKARQQAGDMGSLGSQLLPPSSSAARSLLSPPERHQSVSTESLDGMPSSSTDASSTRLGSQRTPSPLLSPTTDPNYNPQYDNDAPVPLRQGWDKALNFLVKHSSNIGNATKTYVTSHWEFGGALADYNGLRSRYAVLRLLEDGKDINGKATRKIRFVNYYTASTGRPPKVKTGVTEQNAAQQVTIEEERDSGKDSISLESRLRGNGERQDSTSSVQPSREQIGQRSSGEAFHNSVHVAQIKNTHLDDDEDLYGDGMSSGQTKVMTDVEPEAEAESEAGPIIITDTRPMPSTEMPAKALSSLTSVSTITTTSSLPPLGPLPEPPSAVDLDSIPNKDERKLAMKEYSRRMQIYQRAVKDREKAIKERQKLLEKREKPAEKNRLKKMKQEEKEKAQAKKKEPKLREPGAMTSTNPSSDQIACLELAEASRPGKKDKTGQDPGPDKHEKPTKETHEAAKEKPRKERKFCMLPPKDSRGLDDKCWPRVYMEGVDEVGAHCGLFVADSPHYEGLVYNVGNRIKEWVVEARALHKERLLATQDFDRWREKV